MHPLEWVKWRFTDSRISIPAVIGIHDINFLAKVVELLTPFHRRGYDHSTPTAWHFKRPFVFSVEKWTSSGFRDFGMRSAAAMRAWPPICTGKINCISSTLSGENTYKVFNFFLEPCRVHAQKIPEYDRMSRWQPHFPIYQAHHILDQNTWKMKWNLKTPQSLFFISDRFSTVYTTLCGVRLGSPYTRISWYALPVWYAFPVWYVVCVPTVICVWAQMHVSSPQYFLKNRICDKKERPFMISCLDEMKY